MRPSLLRTASVLLMLVLCLGLADSALAVGGENRIALIIGNGAYKSAPLKNPVKDARDMAALLKSLGFAVTLKVDAEQKDMEEAVRQFGLDLRQGGVGLFYFAGHGLQVGGNNYLVPVDAKIQTESDVRFECVDAGRVLGKMEDAGNELNIVILDACRNNPFARGFRSAGQGLARMDAPTGSLVAYSTAPNSVASDGRGQNGLYTKHLLENINAPGVPIEEVFKRVRIGVMNETGKKQVPWESSSLAGYFYLAGGQPQGAAAQAARQLAAAQAAQQQRVQDERLKDYIAGLEAERKYVEREKAELVRRREQLDAEAARRLKAEQSPEETRIKEQLAILEAERRKLEMERAELAAARAKVEQAQASAQQTQKLGRKQVASIAPAPAPTFSPPRVEDRAAILQRLAGVWRLETENGMPLPLLVLKPGGDTLYGSLEGDSRSEGAMSLTGLAMEKGNLHLRLSKQLPQAGKSDPGRFLLEALSGRQAEQVIECVGYLRATDNGGIPLFCQRVDSGARTPAQRQRVAGRMVRVEQPRGW